MRLAICNVHPCRNCRFCGTLSCTCTGVVAQGIEQAVGSVMCVYVIFSYASDDSQPFFISSHQAPGTADEGLAGVHAGQDVPARFPVRRPWWQQLFELQILQTFVFAESAGLVADH